MSRPSVEYSERLKLPSEPLTEPASVLSEYHAVEVIALDSEAIGRRSRICLCAENCPKGSMGAGS